MSFFKSIIIIITILIIIAVGANFYYPKAVSGILNSLAGAKNQTPPETKCPENVPVFCETPSSSNSESILETAARSCRVFGSFTIGDFGNIKQVLPDLSENYRTKMTNWIESQKNIPLSNDEFDSIITSPVEGKTIFSDEKNGQILVLTNRVKIKDNIKKEPVKENCLVDFRKNDTKWEIENILFSKIE